MITLVYPPFVFAALFWSGPNTRRLLQTGDLLAWLFNFHYSRVLDRKDMGLTLDLFLFKKAGSFELKLPLCIVLLPCYIKLCMWSALQMTKP